MSDNEGLARRFFGAFGRADSTDVMRDAMTEDAVTWITNAEGGSDRVEGREGWIARVPSLEGAEGHVDVVDLGRAQEALVEDHVLGGIEADVVEGDLDALAHRMGLAGRDDVVAGF